MTSVSVCSEMSGVEVITEVGNGTGSVAGARPVRTAPSLLTPALSVCGGTGRKLRPKRSEE
jgi:hypothetical protein